MPRQHGRVSVQGRLASGHPGPTKRHHAYDRVHRGLAAAGVDRRARWRTLFRRRQHGQPDPRTHQPGQGFLADREPVDTAAGPDQQLQQRRASRRRLRVGLPTRGDPALAGQRQTLPATGDDRRNDTGRRQWQ